MFGGIRGLLPIAYDYQRLFESNNDRLSEYSQFMIQNSKSFEEITKIEMEIIEGKRMELAKNKFKNRKIAIP